MKREFIIKSMAGTLVLASIWMSHGANPAFMWVTVFVGANSLQSAFTKFCLAEILLAPLGVGDD
jgi:hypothetical protein